MAKTKEKGEENTVPRVSENPALSFLRRHRGDLLLIAVFLAVAGVALLLLRACSAPGGVAVVTVDGEEVGRYDLSRDGTYPIVGWNGGSNLLVIEDGAARVAEASCPDKLCAHTGHISRTGERIVCLPNRVVVEIRAADPAPDFSLGTESPRALCYPHALVSFRAHCPVALRCGASVPGLPLSRTALGMQRRTLYEK